MSVWLALMVAGGMAAFLIKSRWNYKALPALPACPRAITPPDLTVIVPARNEEATIARVVQSFPGVRVVVVDDASDDQTAAVALKAGAEVVEAPRLSPSVLGKPNACRAGAAVADSEWLLFVDADTWYQQNFADSIVRYAESEGLDVVTAFLNQHTITRAEQVLLPYAFALYFCGVSAAGVNSAGSKEALANGQCLLFRRAAYEAVGGHGAVIHSVIEDVALAVLAKSRGLKLRVVRAEHLGSVRMYDSLHAIRRGFEKNSFRFLAVNPLTGVQVMAASTLLTSYLPILVYLGLQGYWTAAAAFSLAPTLLLRAWYPNLASSIAAPAAIYGFQAIALSAMARTIAGIKTTWKGRSV